MKKASLGILAAAGLALGAAACSQNSFGTIAVTKDPSAVSGCEKVADVAASAGRFDDTSAQTQLTRAAQDLTNLSVELQNVVRRFRLGA